MEMSRKLILTSFLAVLYSGEPPQLAGSLLTIFVFLILHILLKPYLNEGLNVFQRLASLSQFLTVFGALMFVIMDFMERDMGAAQGKLGKDIVAYMIVACNVMAAIMYPLYKLISALLDFGEVDSPAKLHEQLSAIIISVIPCASCLPCLAKGNKDAVADNEAPVLLDKVADAAGRDAAGDADAQGDGALLTSCSADLLLPEQETMSQALESDAEEALVVGRTRNGVSPPENHEIVDSLYKTHDALFNEGTSLSAVIYESLPPNQRVPDTLVRDAGNTRCICSMRLVSLGVASE